MRPNTLFDLALLKNPLPNDTDVYTAANSMLLSPGTTVAGVECGLMSNLDNLKTPIDKNLANLGGC